MTRFSYSRNDDGSLRDADFNHDHTVTGAFLTGPELKTILYALKTHEYCFDEEIMIEKLLKESN